MLIPAFQYLHLTASFGLPSLSSDARIDEENARFVKLVLSNLFEQSKLFDAVTISESPAETDVQQPSTTTPSAPEETEPQTDSTTVEAVTSDALPSSPESTESTQPEETSSPISELETTTATTTTSEDTTETTEPSTEAVTETATETVSEAVTEIETVTITEAITDATTELNTETTSETSSESLLNSEDTTIGIVSDIQDEAGTPVRPGDGGDEDAVVLPPDSPPALSSIESLNDTFNKFFTHKRSDEHDAALKNESREGALNIFRTLGFETLTQRFEVRGSVLSRSSKPGTNLIGIMPGKHRGEPGETLMVIAGHYDTVDSCPGVDDNGAGSVAVLEAARLLSPYRGFLNSTIIFALFDLEEKVSAFRSEPLSCQSHVHIMLLSPGPTRKSCFHARISHSRGAAQRIQQIDWSLRRGHASHFRPDSRIAAHSLRCRSCK